MNRKDLTAAVGKIVEYTTDGYVHQDDRQRPYFGRVIEVRPSTRGHNGWRTSERNVTEAVIEPLAKSRRGWTDKDEGWTDEGGVRYVEGRAVFRVCPLQDLDQIIANLDAQEAARRAAEEARHSRQERNTALTQRLQGLVGCSTALSIGRYASDADLDAVEQLLRHAEAGMAGRIEVD